MRIMGMYALAPVMGFVAATYDAVSLVLTPIALVTASPSLLLAWSGFQGVNVVATIILLPIALLSVSAFRAAAEKARVEASTPVP